MQARFTGKSIDGKFIPDHIEQRRAWLMCCDGKELQETLGPPEKDQTAEQRGYYWGVICTKYGESVGDSKEGVDFDLRQELLVVDRGGGKKRIKSTGELDRYEYSDYIDRIIILLAQQGYVVEPPDRNWNKTGWYVKQRTNDQT